LGFWGPKTPKPHEIIVIKMGGKPKKGKKGKGKKKKGVDDKLDDMQ